MIQNKIIEESTKTSLVPIPKLKKKSYFICVSEVSYYIKKNRFPNFFLLLKRFIEKNFDIHIDSCIEKKEIIGAAFNSLIDSIIVEDAKIVNKTTDNKISFCPEISKIIIEENYDELYSCMRQIAPKKYEHILQFEYENELFNQLVSKEMGIRREIECVKKNNIKYNNKYYSKAEANYIICGRIDGIENDMIIEIKNRKKKINSKLQSQDEIQCLLYMYITGIKKCFLKEFYKTKTISFEIKYDEKKIAVITTVLNKFCEYFTNWMSGCYFRIFCDNTIKFSEKKKIAQTFFINFFDFVREDLAQI